MEIRNKENTGTLLQILANQYLPQIVALDRGSALGRRGEHTFIVFHKGVKSHAIHAIFVQREICIGEQSVISFLSHRLGEIKFSHCTASSSHILRIEKKICWDDGQLRRCRL